MGVSVVLFVMDRIRTIAPANNKTMMAETNNLFEGLVFWTPIFPIQQKPINMPA
jgi:hypothetical protein